MSKKIPEIIFELKESEIESTLLNIEECEDESEGLQTIAVDILKSKGHLSYNDSEQGNQSFAITIIFSIQCYMYSKVAYNRTCTNFQL